MWTFGPDGTDLSVYFVDFRSLIQGTCPSHLVDFSADETHDEIQQEKEAESKESSPTHTGKRPDLFREKIIIGGGFGGWGFGVEGGF